MSDCIFCKILNKEIPSEVVFEDDQVLVIKDINPLAPVHLLMITKKHIASLNEVLPEDEALLGHILMLAQKLAQEFGVAESGYRVVTNIGKEGGQAVPHLHFHVLGGKPLGVNIG
ncbi:histidine triad nucleotide-binding protein [Desulfitobacterium sp.]|uniref:histidine triad nucleotide-binding protein n=1 Tax=Desulfitobacterium sp. TaxID=49981 RepID=UPI002B8BA7A0|nr:histidine triad nucleotide-binding protein [Desulfitobacterium sp.]HVJ50185.1 histidine triad nucleotide-binding protein [Desulfitobacterium sp.]